MVDKNKDKDLGTQGAADTVKGKAKEATGKVQKNVGKAVGNQKMTAKGKAKEAAGKTQAKGGKVERKADKALNPKTTLD